MYVMKWSQFLRNFFVSSIRDMMCDNVYYKSNERKLINLQSNLFLLGW